MDGATERASWEERIVAAGIIIATSTVIIANTDITITVTITVTVIIAITFAIKKPINMKHQKQLTSAGTVGPNCIHWAGLN